MLLKQADAVRSAALNQLKAEFAAEKESSSAEFEAKMEALQASYAAAEAAAANALAEREEQHRSELVVAKRQVETLAAKEAVARESEWQAKLKSFLERVRAHSHSCMLDVAVDARGHG